MRAHAPLSPYGRAQESPRCKQQPPPPARGGFGGRGGLRFYSRDPELPCFFGAGGYVGSVIFSLRRAEPTDILSLDRQSQGRTLAWALAPPLPPPDTRLTTKMVGGRGGWLRFLEHKKKRTGQHILSPCSARGCSRNEVCDSDYFADYGFNALFSVGIPVAKRMI